MTPPTIAPVPNKPKTPMHSFRIDDERWEAAKAAAEKLDTTVAAELRKAVDRLIKRAEK